MVSLSVARALLGEASGGRQVAERWSWSNLISSEQLDQTYIPNDQPLLAKESSYGVIVPPVADPTPPGACIGGGWAV
jgi:hypothetical protein